MMLAFWLSGFLALSGHMAPTNSPPADLEPAIRERLEGLLRDPNSAEITITRGPRQATIPADVRPMVGVAVCARINAKNGYGAYTGSEPWVFVWGSNAERSWINAIQVSRLRSADRAAMTAECEHPAD
ncbi:hypothetical protein [uncultured Brevundimonas sp.]|uniref:hypothetical protein n=1 Tax=uncultured Brevundimonas sp. TaxID=213418 RepID=UPI002616C4C9|nr:hypothetical protein [uncultured Brevundimonas sp.]